MDVQAYYRNLGLSEEDIATLTANPKVNEALSSLAQKAEDGITAFQKAQEIQTNMDEWNKNTVVPQFNKLSQQVAKAEAEVAQRNAYLKALKDQGYEIPDTYLGAVETPSVAPATAAPSSRDYSEDIHQAARANMELISLSERARDLLGHGLDVAAEYEEFGKSKRPGENLRAYIDRKYELSAVAKRKDEEKKQKYEDDIRAEAAKEAIAKYQQTHGANPETRNPKASRFDQIKAERGADGDKRWQTQAGREQATKDRIAKYKNPAVN